jgi:hypothetical protein
MISVIAVKLVRGNKILLLDCISGREDSFPYDDEYYDDPMLYAAMVFSRKTNGDYYRIDCSAIKSGYTIFVII